MNTDHWPRMNTDEHGSLAIYERFHTDERRIVFYQQIRVDPCFSVAYKTVFFRGSIIRSSGGHGQPWRNGCSSAPSFEVSTVGGIAAAGVNVNRFTASSPQCLATASTSWRSERTSSARLGSDSIR
jgi:hypothetical protein